MNKSPKQVFTRLIQTNRHAKDILRKILLLDDQLEELKRSGPLNLMMDPRIPQIERRTEEAAQMAVDLAGGDAEKYASWLSYNIRELSHLLGKPRVPIMKLVVAFLLGVFSFFLFFSLGESVRIPSTVSTATYIVTSNILLPKSLANFSR